MATLVVNLKHAPYDVYIGRPTAAHPDAPWGNPFVIGKDGDRATVIAKYEQWLLTQPALLARLPELRGQRLGCYCAPAACHGHVLARLADTLPAATLAGEGDAPMATTPDARQIAECKVARAAKAGARYNELHTAYWKAAPAQRPAARQALVQATPLLLAIRREAEEAATAVNWPWPAQRTPPWTTTTAVPPARPPEPSPSRPVAPRPTSSRRALPAPALITPAELRHAPHIVTAKEQFNAKLTEARRLGKPAGWLPLRTAAAALQRVLTTPPPTLQRVVLAH